MRRRLCLLALLAGPMAQAQSLPYTPADDAVVLERQVLPKRSIAGLHALREQQQRLSEHPDDLEQAAAFARTAIALGREEADPRYYGYAESALRPWSELPSPPDTARLLRATLRQQRHDFAGALVDLDALIAADGADPQAHLTRAIVLMVQGRPADALRDCFALIGRTSVLANTTCIAQARSLDGHAAAAYGALTAALANSGDSAPPDERSWALTSAAEIAERHGDTVAAETQFRTALAALTAADRRDPYLLTAYADFLLAQNRAEEVRARLAADTRIDNLLLRLTLAEAALGDPAAAAHQRLLQARFGETRQRGDSVHLREETMFELLLKHDAMRAVMLAAQNWQTQREPTDARLLLQASLAAQRPDLAQPVLEWLQRTGIEDPALHALAAQITGAAR